MSKRDGRKKVLFVCVGNACRSPMAEAIARVDARDAIDAFSAGLMPIGFVAELTKQTLMKNGYWVEGLESKRISPGVWERVDVVINMSGRPKEEAFGEYSRVVDWDVEDPFEREPEDYQRAFDTIRARVRELAEDYRKEYAANRAAERRTRPRLYADAPISISLNGWNDARVVNISEDGLSLSSDAALPSRPLQNLRIQFMGPPHGLDARCQIAWKSSDNKQAGIQFVELTEAARQFIRNWISEQASYIGFHIQVDRNREGQNLRLDIPSGSMTGIATSGGNTALEIRREALVPAPATSRPLGNGSRIPLQLWRRARAAGRLEISSLPAKILSRVTKPGPSRRPWVELAAVVMLTAGFTWGLHSVATHREVRSDVRTEVPPETIASNEAKLTTPTPPPATIPTTPSGVSLPASGTGQGELAPIIKSPPAAKADDVQHDAAGASSSRTAARPANESSRGGLVKAAHRDAENRSPRKPPDKPTRRFAADAKISPVKKSPVKTVASAISVPPAIEIKLPETANLATARSAENHPAESAAMTNSAASDPRKLPEKTPLMTAEVSVLSDPYPSLHASGSGSKKQRERTATLQLGHLLSRVVPEYPEEAKRQGIQGTVKLHAIVDKYGSVRSMQPLSGPPILGAAVMNAMRRWQYTETTLGGEPVETDVDVAVVFRLANPAAPKS